MKLHIDLSSKIDAGKIDSCAVLVVGEEGRMVKFCAKGVLEGVMFAGGIYVIRPEQRRNGTIPDLRFSVITRELPEFKITRITCASMADHPKMLTNERDRFHTELLNSPGPLRAELARATISPPEYEAAESLNIRRVSVPMQLDGSNSAYNGFIIVDYVVGGKEMQASA